MQQFGGEGGIRTLGTGYPVRQISNLVPSTTRPPLRVEEFAHYRTVYAVAKTFATPSSVVDVSDSRHRHLHGGDLQRHHRVQRETVKVSNPKGKKKHEKCALRSCA